MVAAASADCFPYGYYFFGWKIATTAVSALSIQGVIGQACFVFIVPVVRPDYWRDRVGARPLLIWVNIGARRPRCCRLTRTSS